MAEKVTEMKLKVDLQCPCCYKKVKKILCKFPQIRDQVYDEKNNIVKIIVVCCNPEKFRDKLCCKGAKVIKSIEIVEPPPPKPKPKPTAPPQKVVPPPPPAKPVPKPTAPPEKEVPPPPPPKPVPEPKAPSQKEEPAPASPPKAPEPVPVFVPAFPNGFCCPQCYEGHSGGPCYQGYGYGRPVPPPPCYDPYGYPYGYGYRRCHVSRRDEYYFSDENPSSCSIM